jgi:hypothetical protein
VVDGAVVDVVADRLARPRVEDAASASCVVSVAQPSPMPDRVRSPAGELASVELVAVATDALVVRSADAPGAEETTTAVRTATPRAALPAATVHQRRRGERRTACRGLIGGLPERPVPSGAPPPPKPHATID